MPVCYNDYDLPFDILRHICLIGCLDIDDLRSFSRASHRLRKAAVSELFRCVKVDEDWTKALGRLREMKKKNLDLGRYWRSFRFELDVPEEELHTDPPITEVCSLLHDIFASAVSMTYLSVHIPEEHINSFQDALGSYNLRLPTVKTLVVGPFCEFLVPMCPNLKTLSTIDWQWLNSNAEREHSKRLIRAAKEVRGLETFEMVEYWTEDLLSLLSQSIPDVKTLSLQYARPLLGIHTLAPFLTPFKSMRTLILPSPAHLDVGFTIPFCCASNEEPEDEESENEESEGEDPENEESEGDDPEDEELEGEELREDPENEESEGEDPEDEELEGEELREDPEREIIIAQGKVMDILLSSCPWVENVWLGAYTKVVVKDGVVTKTVDDSWRAVAYRHE